MFLENYQKIVWTTITHSTHNVTEGKRLTRRLWKTKYKLQKATFIANRSYNLFLLLLTMAVMILLKTVFGKINVFCRSLMLLSFYIYLHYSSHKHTKHELDNYSMTA